MTIQLATTTRNARLDAIETDTGTSARLVIFSGSQPANCAAANNGSALVSYTLASDWAAAASSGAKALSSLPLSTAAGASGTAGYFRIFKSDVVTCTVQGSVGTSGTDMIIDNTSINSGQTVNVTGFTLTDGNA